MLKTTLENTHLLNADEMMALCCAASGIRNIDCKQPLDSAYDELKAWFPKALVYQGGNHIALHMHGTTTERNLIVTEFTA